MVHFEDFKPTERTWLTNHLVGLLHWAKEWRPDLLEKPDELLSFYLRYAVVNPQIRKLLTEDLHFVAACHHFLDDCKQRLDQFPDFKKYRPSLSYRPISPEQRSFLQTLINALPEGHSAKKLDLQTMDSNMAKQWIDRLRRKVG